MVKQVYKISTVIVLALTFSISCAKQGQLYEDSNGYGSSSEYSCKFVDYQALETEVVLTEVPFISQAKNNCGYASLEMVLRSKGESIDQYELADNSEAVLKNGVSAEQILVKAQELGFINSSIASCGLNNMLELIQQGFPVIARVYNKDFTAGHFVVVTGFNKDSEILYVNDPEVGNTDTIEISFSDFQALWDVNTLGKNNSNFLMIIVK